MQLVTAESKPPAAESQPVTAESKHAEQVGS